jgi:hypothetical protein
MALPVTKGGAAVDRNAKKMGAGRAKLKILLPRPEKARFLLISLIHFLG